MTPQEEAKELVEQIRKAMSISKWEYKQLLPIKMGVKNIAYLTADKCHQEAYKQGTDISLLRQDHWKQVKTEIDKL